MVGITFTGKEIRGLGDPIPATCIVRNEVNGWRKRDQIVRTTRGTAPWAPGVAYQPRPFPPGTWRVNGVYKMAQDSVFWPYFINTEAVQTLNQWSTRFNAELARTEYHKRLDVEFEGLGYGIHHARYNNGTGLVRSRTTLGCINITDPADVVRLAEQLKDIRYHEDVVIIIPPWEHWEA